MNIPNDTFAINPEDLAYIEHRLSIYDSLVKRIKTILHEIHQKLDSIFIFDKENLKKQNPDIYKEYKSFRGDLNKIIPLLDSFEGIFSNDDNVKNFESHNKDYFNDNDNINDGCNGNESDSDNYDNDHDYDNDSDNECNKRKGLLFHKKKLTGKILYKKKLKKRVLTKEHDKMKQLELDNGKLKKEINKLKYMLNDIKKSEHSSNMSNIHIELNYLANVSKNNRVYSDDLLKLSFLLYRLSSSSYELMRKYLPFPSHNKIYKQIRLTLPYIIEGLKQNDPKMIVHPTIQKVLSSTQSVPIVLGIDALCIVATSRYNHSLIKNLYSFTVYIQPVFFGYKCMPIRLIEKENGIGNREILRLLQETSNQLKSINFDVRFNSFDGDKCYNILHKNFFDEYEIFILNDDLEGAVNKMKNKQDIPIGDYMHIFKNLRSRFKKCKIALDKDAKYTFSLNDLKQSLGDSNQYLNDNSFLSSMRDILALELFDINNVVTLLEKNNVILAIALMPMSLFHFAIRSINLPLYDRIYCFTLSFWLLHIFLLNTQLRNKRIIGLQKNESKEYCSFYSEIGLKRFMNTILAILIAFNMEYESICLDRFGTHCLELFFGLIRGFSKGVDGWERFYSTVGKTVLADEYLENLGISPIIKHRMNLAGVCITDHLDKAQFSEIYKNAHIMAKELFESLFTAKYNIESESFSKFKAWLNEMSIYFPKVKTFNNPVSGVKIIARLINASKSGKIHEEEEEEEYDEDDNDEEDENH